MLTYVSSLAIIYNIVLTQGKFDGRIWSAWENMCRSSARFTPRFPTRNTQQQKQTKLNNLIKSD